MVATWWPTLFAKRTLQQTVLHITHPKAGSQWIHRILLDCGRERVVAPDLPQDQFLRRPLQPGMVYPTLYITRDQFESVPAAQSCRRFVVIRDPRDVLVSAYFSIKFSHSVLAPTFNEWRQILNTRSEEEGLLFLMDYWLVNSSAIPQSWCASGEPVIRYEDLLHDDLEILSRVLLGECRLPVSPRRFRNIVLANRFERITKGRVRGQEDRMAHERKGEPGDWRNHFSARTKEDFKRRFGPLLTLTGYEADEHW